MLIIRPINTRISKSCINRFHIHIDSNSISCFCIRMKIFNLHSIPIHSILILRKHFRIFHDIDFTNCLIKHTTVCMESNCFLMIRFDQKTNICRIRITFTLTRKDKRAIQSKAIFSLRKSIIEIRQREERNEFILISISLTSTSLINQKSFKFTHIGFCSIQNKKTRKIKINTYSECNRITFINHILFICRFNRKICISDYQIMFVIHKEFISSTCILDFISNWISRISIQMP